MDVSKRINIWVNIDEIVENASFNENRLLIRPLVTKMLKDYQNDYDQAVKFEKEHKREGRGELAIWQAKRQVALSKIVELLTGILENLLKLNQPLKDYHNDCMGFHGKVEV